MIRRKVNFVKNHAADSKFTPFSTIGYYLVALEPINFTEPIIIDKPFVNLVPAFVEARHDRCHHCLTSCFKICAFKDEVDVATKVQQLPSGPARIFAPVPCPNCSNVIFCSVHCRNEAINSYHRFECCQLPFLREIGDEAHLALRMLYNVNGGLNRVKEVAAKFENDEFSFDDMKDSRDYALVYNLKQLEKPDYEDELMKTLIACFLAKLATLSGFVQVCWYFVGFY